MQNFYKLLLILHIAAGSTALLSGGIAFSVRKGKGTHSKAGLIYYYAMLMTGFSAISMCTLKYNPFLFIVGIFSLYMTYTGYRSLQVAGSKPTLYSDWLPWGVTLLGTLTFLFLNLSQQMNDFTPVLLTFGFILIGMILKDLRDFRQAEKLKRPQLLLKHISRMGGAYIATVTAFVVTNVHMEPVYIQWLLPTAIGTPLIIYFQRKFSPKKKQKSSLPA